ncbi:MAG: carboxypeptidase-like regulatory domain-containing protein [Acidobacteriota bacterium]
MASSRGAVEEARSAGAKIHGTVSDLFGSPIRRAKVQVLSQGGERRTIFTNDGGEYEAGNLSRGEKMVKVAYRGFQAVTETVLLRENETVLLNFGLVVGKLVDLPSIQLRGSVRQSDGKALEGATVTAVSVFNQGVRFKRQTDRDGRYCVDIDQPGQYVIYALKAGFIVDTTSMNLSAELPRKHREVNFRLTPFSASQQSP